MEDDARVRNLSNLFYYHTEGYVGSENIVRYRRQFRKIVSDVRHMTVICPHDHIDSGSMAEGLIFHSSDIDTMVVYKQITIVMDYLTAFTRNNCSRQFLNNTLLMEMDRTNPGFCLLRVLTGENIVIIGRSSVQYQNNIYLSSALWRNEVEKQLPESTEHGPCESGIIHGTEVDVALCLKCPKWPDSALSCVNRLARSGWISSCALGDIFSKGCHIVAIGDKTSDTEILEWRISFSEAEKMLIHSMNHCQFLCYGLMKKFLKEVINSRKDVSNLLCSYFLKTVILWEICYNSASWGKEDFLKRFWDCFRRLISWVKYGYCPNFFIPENNMFKSKIHGRSQNIILHHLVSLYRKGYKCLPLCRCPQCTYILNSPRWCTFNYPPISYTKAAEDMEIIRFICEGWFIADLSNLYVHLAYFQHAQQTITNESDPFLSTINILNSMAIQHLFFYSIMKNSLYLHLLSNKKRCEIIFKFIRAMRRVKFDFCTHKLLSTILLYNLGMYHHVIRNVTEIWNRMQQRQFLYSFQSIRICDYYALGGESTPFDVMIKKFFVRSMRLFPPIWLPELLPEEQLTVAYPPLVFTNLLLYLSYYRLSMHEEAGYVLNDLTCLLCNDDPCHVISRDRAISWQILGICQEMSGLKESALMSYLRALADPSGSLFRLSTLCRIQNLLRFWN